MPNVVPWPLEVDLETVRSQQKVLFDKLKKAYPWIGAYLPNGTPQQRAGVKSMIKNGEIKIDENSQAAMRHKIIQLIDEDKVIENVVDFKTVAHKSILLQTALDEIFSFGPLGPLLRDPSVGDIWVNGPSEIYTERDGNVERSVVSFEDRAHLEHTIAKILEPLGKELTEASPAVRCLLPNGRSWVIAALPPPSDPDQSPTLIIRSQSEMSKRAAESQ
jgi:Flp pilus assembly CpaF family ATPase